MQKSPEVQTHHRAERPLAASVLCTIIFWDSWKKRLFAISSEFKTQVLAGILGDIWGLRDLILAVMEPTATTTHSPSASSSCSKMSFSSPLHWS